MAKNETIHVRVNEDIKNSSEAVLSKLGMTMSEAINMFLCQVSLVGGIPFEVKLPAPESVIVRSEEELLAKLEESNRDIAEGRTISAEEFFARMEKRLGFKRSGEENAV